MTALVDLIINNAHVFTADSETPSAEAVAIRGNRIVFVGGNAEAAEWSAPGTRQVDAGGRTLIPGFIDSHYHLMMSSLVLDDINPESASTYSELALIVKDFATRYPDKHWLSGSGLKYNLGPGNAPLTRHHLDALISDRPVFIISYCGHTAWANTLALKEAGIFHGGACGKNGVIVLDEHGEATGELRESAMGKIEDLLPKLEAVEKQRLLKKGLQMASRLGITSIHNMDGDAEQAAFYSTLEESRELSVRIYVPYTIKPEISFETLEKDALFLKRRYQSDMLRGGCVKLFMDGVTESYTALLVDEYADKSGEQGGSDYEVESFNRLVVEADRLGLQIFVHAIGDLGVRRVLDAYALAQARNGKRDCRHRIEHIEIIHPDDIHRFAELGVIASMQPLHVPGEVDGMDVWPRRVGLQRWPYSFAWQTLRSARARLVFGSDWSVVSQNPLLGVHRAVTRLPWAENIPHQRQSLADTLLSYTRDAAYAEFQEDRKGQLKPGFLADLVLLSKDIFAVPPENIKDMIVNMTMLDGRIVYENNL